MAINHLSFDEAPVNMRVLKKHTPKSMANPVRCYLFILIAAIGCGDGRVVLPKAPVTGKVTFREKPLTTGRILFIHQSGQAVAADLSADGTFDLDVFQGMNQVAIACFEPDPPNADPQARFSMVIRKSLIPEQYASCNSSGLSFDVKPGESNRAVFELKD